MPSSPRDPNDDGAAIPVTMSAWSSSPLSPRMLGFVLGNGVAVSSAAKLKFVLKRRPFMELLTVAPRWNVVKSEKNGRYSVILLIASRETNASQLAFQYKNLPHSRFSPIKSIATDWLVKLQLVVE